MINVPISPAPAAPNNEVMIATPEAEPSATATPLPNKVPTPAAKKGAARPPVTPGKTKCQICGIDYQGNNQDNSDTGSGSGCGEEHDGKQMLVVMVILH